MEKTKVKQSGTLLLGWTAFMLVSIVLSFWYPIFAGVVFGGIVTFAVVGLALKWGAESMTESFGTEIEQVNETLK